LLGGCLADGAAANAVANGGIAIFNAVVAARVHESAATSPDGQHVVVTLERTSTGGTRREAQMKQAAHGAMTGAERAEKKRKRASLFPRKAAAQASKHAERQKAQRKWQADDAAAWAAVEVVVANLVAAVEAEAEAAAELEPPEPHAIEGDFHRLMILKAAAQERRYEEAVAFWAPQVPQRHENAPFRRVRMRSITVQFAPIGRPPDRRPNAVETFSDCDVIFSTHCIWIGKMFHIWHRNTESGRGDDSVHTRAVYSCNTIELETARVRLGEGCSRHWLTVSNPTAAMLMYGCWTATRPIGGYDRVRSFKSRAPYALADGTCRACTLCSRGEVPAYSAHITMVLEGSSEPQRYREQMDALMPRVVSSLECGIPGTFPVHLIRS